MFYLCMNTIQKEIHTPLVHTYFFRHATPGAWCLLWVHHCALNTHTRGYLRTVFPLALLAVRSNGNSREKNDKNIRWANQNYLFSHKKKKVSVNYSVILYFLHREIKKNTPRFNFDFQFAFIKISLFFPCLYGFKLFVWKSCLWGSKIEKKFFFFYDLFHIKFCLVTLTVSC